MSSDMRSVSDPKNKLGHMVVIPVDLH